MIRFNPSLNNYILTLNGVEIPCHNRSTAEYLLRLSNNPESRKELDISQLDFEQVFGCALVWHNGRPAVQWSLTGRVEPVHNWATARTLQNDSMTLLDDYLKVWDKEHGQG